MSFLSPKYSKNGPGIPKDQPPKKGFVLFFEIFVREFWNLIKLNLLFFLFCIPIITIPPAMAGMTYVLSKMVRDENSFIWSDFWKAFKENLKWSYVLGTVSLLFLLSTISSLYIAFYQGQSLFFGLALVSNIIGIGFTMNAFTMLTTIDLPLKNIMKNAFLLTFSCLNTTLLSVLIIDAIVFLAINYIFYIFPLFILILFSLIAFIATFVAWAGIKKYVIVSENEDSE